MAAKGKTYDVHAVGRRKTSVARVYVKSGNGTVSVNHREIKDYFPKATNRYVVNQPVNLLKVADRYDINVNVRGGGTTGQGKAERRRREGRRTT